MQRIIEAFKQFLKQLQIGRRKRIGAKARAFLIKQASKMARQELKAARKQSFAEARHQWWVSKFTAINDCFQEWRQHHANRRQAAIDAKANTYERKRQAAAVAFRIKQEAGAAKMHALTKSKLELRQQKHQQKLARQAIRRQWFEELLNRFRGWRAFRRQLWSKRWTTWKREMQNAFAGLKRNLSSLRLQYKQWRLHRQQTKPLRQLKHAAWRLKWEVRFKHLIHSLPGFKGTGAAGLTLFITILLLLTTVLFLKWNINWGWALTGVLTLFMAWLHRQSKKGKSFDEFRDYLGFKLGCLGISTWVLFFLAAWSKGDL